MARKVVGRYTHHRRIYRMTAARKEALKKAQMASVQVRAKGAKASPQAFNKAVLHGHAKLVGMMHRASDKRKYAAAKTKLWSKLREQ